jgi:hypothetical protein
MTFIRVGLQLKPKKPPPSLFEKLFEIVTFESNKFEIISPEADKKPSL